MYFLGPKKLQIDLEMFWRRKNIDNFGHKIFCSHCNLNKPIAKCNKILRQPPFLLYRQTYLALSFFLFNSVNLTMNKSKTIFQIWNAIFILKKCCKISKGTCMAFNIFANIFINLNHNFKHNKLYFKKLTRNV